MNERSFAMSIPPKVSRLFVFRRPVFEDGGYSIVSEDKRYQAEASVPSPAGMEWTFTYRSPVGVTVAPMRVGGLCFDMLDEKGCSVGRVKEARFSIAGKLVVEDENERILGFLVPTSWTNVSFLAADGREFAIAKHYRDGKSKLPLLLKEHQMHLARRYVVERTLPLPFDEPMIIGFVGLMVAEERST